ncbi:MAG: hypothetical protein K6G65_04440, partial [Lachnospiraceae bacterium]|nr:hypothetical protein [Lachnospiraceae bacterium]
MVKEFRECTQEEVVKAIEGDFYREDIPVTATKEYEQHKEYGRIMGNDTVHKEPGEGTTVFDVFFSVHTIKGERRKI